MTANPRSTGNEVPRTFLTQEGPICSFFLLATFAFLSLGSSLEQRARRSASRHLLYSRSCTVEYASCLGHFLTELQQHTLLFRPERMVKGGKQACSVSQFRQIPSPSRFPQLHLSQPKYSPVHNQGKRRPLFYL